MILVDTSIWIEYLRGNNEGIELKLAEEMVNSNIIALSPVFGELLQGAKNTREEKIIANLWTDLIKVDEYELFILAGRISYEHKLHDKGLGLIDCAILAAAKISKHEIWSLDKKLMEAGKLFGVTSH